MSTEAPKYFPTRYDSARDEVIGQLAYEPDESTGDVDSPTGYVALVLLAGTAEEIDSEPYARELADTYGVAPADIAGSFLVTSNDQGFVYVESFETEQLARQAFECADARYAVWADEERDEDSDGVYICPVIGHGYHSV